MLHRTLENLLRRVRDTDFCEHTRSALEATYGSSLVVEAITLGFIECQRWQRRASGYVDLTAAGERHLVNMTKEGARSLK